MMDTWESPGTLTPEKRRQGESLQQVCVVIPVRNRSGSRLRNALASIRWQRAGTPCEILVVSHGSTDEINQELEANCCEYGAQLITFGRPKEPWCKPLALNVGIRRSSEDLPWVMTMDADMILAENFLEVVLGVLQQDPQSLVLCRSRDLRRGQQLPGETQGVHTGFERLRRRTRLRRRSGTGGIQAAAREFFFKVQGYDEDLVWWGAEDGDMVRRARLAGLEVHWVEAQTAMIHQWHPKRQAVLGSRAARVEANGAWRRNHQLAQERREIMVRNPTGWGESVCGPEYTTTVAPAPVKPMRLAVFGTATEDYVPYMVTSLRSVRRANEGRPFDYFILGRGFNPSTRELLARHDISYVELDLNDVFKRLATEHYPSECFWIFKGPEIFHERGYTHTLALDGDIYCNRWLDLDWLPQLEHIAGGCRGTSVGRFLRRQLPALRRIFGLTRAGEARSAPSSGVLFWNNAAMASVRFFERVVDVYSRSEAAGIPRRGDHSTLALVLAVDPCISMRILDDTWNAYRGMRRSFAIGRPQYNMHRAEWVDSAYIVHHAYIKPWDLTSACPNRTTEHFVTLWRELHTGTMMEPQTSCETWSVPIYWYRGKRPNFGDEITPWLVRKVAGLSETVHLPPPPHHPRKLSQPVLISVGSVMRLSCDNAVVWGSGIRNIDQPVKQARRFCAVRGPLTRQRLLALGYECPEVYGDPALLMPRWLQPGDKKRYALGVIPHVTGWKALSRHYGDHDSVLVIDLATGDVEKVVAQILSCERTVSCALHGLVISVAYGVPTRWLHSKAVFGDGTKFYDFFASLEPEVARRLDRERMCLPEDDKALERFRPLNVAEGLPNVEEAVEQTFRFEMTLDLDVLLAACPIGPGGWKVGLP